MDHILQILHYLASIGMFFDIKIYEIGDY